MGSVRLCFCITILVLLYSTSAEKTGGGSVKIAALGPWTPPFTSFLTFAKFGVALLNNYTNILPNTTVELVAYETGSTDLGRASYQAVVASQSGVVAFLGGYGTPMQQQIAYASKYVNIPLVGGLTTGSVFSNKAKYPMFMRTCLADQFMAIVMVKFIKSMGWENVALIYQDDDFSMGNQEVFLDEATLVNVSVNSIMIKTGNTDFSAACTKLANSQNRIIVLMTEWAEGNIFLRNASNFGLVGPGFVWLHDSIFASILELTRPTAEFLALMDGSFTFRPAARDQTSELATGIFDAWTRADPVVFPGNHTSVDDASWFLMEGLFTIAIGLDAVMRSTGKNATDVKGNDLYTAMRKLNYPGPSGRVSFDSNGDRIGSYNIYNFYDQGQSKYAVQLYSPYNDSFVTYEENPIFFNGGDPVLPRDLPCFCVHGTCVGYTQECICDEGYEGETCAARMTFRPHSRALSGVLGAAVGLCIIYTILALVVLIVRIEYFQEKSPLFCGLILFGALLAFLGALMVLPEPSDALCMTFPWLVGVGFTLVFGCLFLKTWRIYHVVHSAIKFEKVAIPNVYLIKLLSVGLIAEFILLIVWTAYDPIKATLRPYDDDTTRMTCYAPHMGQFWAAFAGYKILWLIFGTIMAIKTRNLYEKYNESNAIGFSIYNTMAMIVIGIPLAILLKKYPYVLTCVQVILIVVVFLFVITSLFVSTWLRLLFGEQKSLPEIKNLSSSGSPRKSVSMGTRSSLSQSNSGENRIKQMVSRGRTSSKGSKSKSGGMHSDVSFSGEMSPRMDPAAEEAPQTIGVTISAGSGSLSGSTNILGSSMMSLTESHLPSIQENGDDQV